MKLAQPYESGDVPEGTAVALVDPTEAAGLLAGRGLFTRALVAEHYAALVRVVAEPARVFEVSTGDLVAETEEEALELELLGPAEDDDDEEDFEEGDES